MRKVGISGGTFDPIHIGHIKSAEYVFSSLQLDEVVFIPNGHPPHKVTSIVTDELHRLEMVRLAIEDNIHFTVSDIEIKRNGYSYTIDTLQELKKEYEEKYEEVKFYYIIGTDVLDEISSWKESAKVFELCDFAVLKRPGFDFETAKQKAQKSGALIHPIDAPQIDISSTEIRDMLRKGKNVEKYVPKKVYQYIIEKELYKEYKITELEKIKEDLKERLSEKRYIHSLGVMEECVRLGEIYGCDIEKCKLAGLLHDCAKDMSNEQYKWMGINITPTEQDIINGYNEDMLHGKAGRVVAMQRYGIMDEEVLNAIENHVTGRPGMKLLEQIVFLADYTEKNRRGIVFDKIRNELEKGIVNGIIAACDNTLKYLLDKSVLIGVETLLTRNYYVAQLKNKNERKVD